jgi:hypothetical protein
MGRYRLMGTVFLLEMTKTFVYSDGYVTVRKYFTPLNYSLTHCLK